MMADSSAGAIPAANLVSLALKVAEQLRMATLSGQTLGVLANSKLPDDVRTTAAATAVALDKQAAIGPLVSIVGSGAEPVSLRQAVARQLGSTDSQEAREALATAIVTAPAALQQPLAISLASTKAGADLLLARVPSGKASARLLQDKSVVDRLKASGAADAGGKVGPQLDGVGQRGVERLLEDILDPNRNVDEAFRTTLVTTNDGRVISGLKLREEGSDLVLADTTGKELRIAAADIDEVAVSHLSPMASNMLDQIGEKNLSDLLAYLMQQAARP